ncbi:hypothetical protein LZ318_36140 [Saccharopolyspora indica]|uniref:hypothetical protein n=1 Tax=Saccharopolyspora indica TaxID=1229659 RepID=UPI0022EAD962|nr:hypothetical protein [Saccharopolyspora indica]MDA3647395.1 hypothetical protein [Saccharopolyspora indica]
METPSSGRRRDQHGPDSISVAELMRRTPISLKHERLADELLQNDDAADVLPPIRRIAFGTAGVLLLLGATAATATIVAHPADAPRPAAAAPITGGLALRPDLVRDARWPFAGNGGFASTATGDTTVERSEAPQPMAANPAAGSAKSARKVVAEFYRRLVGDAGGAMSMVAPELVAGQQTSVVRAWRAAESVVVDESKIRIEPGGAVLAEVEVRYPAGDRVRLQQRLTVESDSNPKITGAELLGARHTVSR